LRHSPNLSKKNKYKLQHATNRHRLIPEADSSYCTKFFNLCQTNFICKAHLRISCSAHERAVSQAKSCTLYTGKYGTKARKFIVIQLNLKKIKKNEIFVMVVDLKVSLSPILRDRMNEVVKMAA
jgi:hypothetical protein